MTYCAVHGKLIRGQVLLRVFKKKLKWAALVLAGSDILKFRGGEVTVAIKVPFHLS